ncbi:competence/damage-inducible protein A [Magnetococcales bacterium HHB-1]
MDQVINDQSGMVGLIVVGDEILLQRRDDAHFPFLANLLKQQGRKLAWVRYLPDEQAILIENFRQSLMVGHLVFCCGGIGATTDDMTRQSLAEAADVTLQRHPEAQTILERRFNGDIYPYRVRMIEWPKGSEIIPNPINEIPGFSFQNHCCLPGFPEMAQPMMRWVLEQRPQEKSVEQEYSMRLIGIMEGSVVGIIDEATVRFPELKFFSLPSLQPQQLVEIGVRGGEQIMQGWQFLQQAVIDAGLSDYRE